MPHGHGWMYDLLICALTHSFCVCLFPPFWSSCLLPPFWSSLVPSSNPSTLPLPRFVSSLPCRPSSLAQARLQELQMLQEQVMEAARQLDSRRE